MCAHEIYRLEKLRCKIQETEMEDKLLEKMFSFGQVQVATGLNAKAG